MREFATESFTAIGIPEPTQEMLYAHGFRKAQDVANAAAEMLTQFPGFTMDMIPDLQKQAREQSIVDAEKEMRLEQEREAARIAEARRHPDDLTQEERFARVRGVGEKTIEQLKRAGYGTVEAVHAEADVMRARGVERARHQEGAADQARGGRLPRGGGEAPRRARRREGEVRARGRRSLSEPGPHLRRLRRAGGAARSSCGSRTDGRAGDRRSRAQRRAWSVAPRRAPDAWSRR